jgi:hypothetical protein
MIYSILGELERLYPAAQLTHDELDRNWENIKRIFSPQVSELAQVVTSSITPIINQPVLKKSTIECLNSVEAHISIIEYRIRPGRDYYESLNKEIPAPESINGPHATGCEFSISLRASYPTHKGIVPAQIASEFEIWGYHEREAFKEMYRDYKRPIEMLIQDQNFDFFTAVPFDNVDKYKGKNAIKKLELYFENEADAESCFSLSRDFNIDDTMSDLIKASIPLMALYVCTLHYSNIKKNKGAVWQVLQRLLS